MPETSETAQWERLTQIIRDSFGNDLITPSDLQGEYGSLREALILNKGAFPGFTLQMLFGGFRWGLLGERRVKSVV